jgi:hypothetical protein
MPTFDSDKTMDMLGVPGRLTHRTTKPGQAPGLWCNQRWVSEWRPFKDEGDHAVIHAEVRFDDECNNGHNTFAITGTIRDKRYNGDRGYLSGGCVHEHIAKSFPELAGLIKWHLTSSDGPMHYIANTLYHAGDRDHNGLLKDEKRQIISGKTKQPCWELVVINSEGVGISSTPTGDEYRHAETVPLFIIDKHCEGETPPLATPKLKWVPWCRVGEGKARELDHARSSAVWPEATDAELSVERDVLKAALIARHPALVQAFREAMDSTGFVWSPELMPA